MEYTRFSYTERDLSFLPFRPQNSHKGTFGRVLCMCGSTGMSGAAYFAAKAAYRTGAGLVRILTAEENRTVLQTLLPEAIVTVYSASDLDGLREAVAWADVLVIGCGLGVSADSRLCLSEALRLRGEKPLVLDADGLNLLARNPSFAKYIQGAVLTPHIGEMERLIAADGRKILADPPQAAAAFAQKHDVVCVLKSHRTVVSDGGERLYVNTSGNSGMATGGSGDVLAGIIGGILAQSRNGSLSAMDVACLGVYIHGLCGEAAARKKSEYAVMASDLLDCLPDVLRRAERIRSNGRTLMCGEDS